VRLVIIKKITERTSLWFTTTKHSENLLTEIDAEIVKLDRTNFWQELQNFKNKYRRTTMPVLKE
jgi:hypothetical protein